MGYEPTHERECPREAECAACHPHTQDEDCTIGADGCCEICGVSHTVQCDVCGGRGFHRHDCAEMQEIDRSIREGNAERDCAETDPFAGVRAFVDPATVVKFAVVTGNIATMYTTEEMARDMAKHLRSGEVYRIECTRMPARAS